MRDSTIDRIFVFLILGLVLLPSLLSSLPLILPLIIVIGFFLLINLNFFCELFKQ